MSAGRREPGGRDRDRRRRRDAERGLEAAEREAAAGRPERLLSLVLAAEGYGSENLKRLVHEWQERLEEMADDRDDDPAVLPLWKWMAGEIVVGSRDWIDLAFWLSGMVEAEGKDLLHVADRFVLEPLAALAGPGVGDEEAVARYRLAARALGVLPDVVSRVEDGAAEDLDGIVRIMVRRIDVMGGDTYDVVDLPEPLEFMVLPSDEQFREDLVRWIPAGGDLEGVEATVAEMRMGRRRTTGPGERRMRDDPLWTTVEYLDPIWYVAPDEGVELPDGLEERFGPRDDMTFYVHGPTYGLHGTILPPDDWWPVSGFPGHGDLAKASRGAEPDWYRKRPRRPRRNAGRADRPGRAERAAARGDVAALDGIRRRADDGDEAAQGVLVARLRAEAESGDDAALEELGRRWSWRGEERAYEAVQEVVDKRTPPQARIRWHPGDEDDPPGWRAYGWDDGFTHSGEARMTRVTVGEALFDARYVIVDSKYGADFDPPPGYYKREDIRMMYARLRDYLGLEPCPACGGTGGGNESIPRCIACEGTGLGAPPPGAVRAQPPQGDGTGQPCFAPPGARNPAKAEAKAKAVDRIVVRWCSMAQKDHDDSLRQYAHCYHRDPPVVCVCREWHDLPRGHRDGVAAHEVGHLLAGPRGSEKAADEAFRKASGHRIDYRDGRWGERLQWIDDSGSRALRRLVDIDDQGAG